MPREILRINRGDSLKLTVKITYGGESYLLTPNDAVYFGVMEPHQPFETAMIKKKYVTGQQYESDLIDIVLHSSDTVHLTPGIYYYSVKLRKNIGAENEEVITIKDRTKLVIYES